MAIDVRNVQPAQLADANPRGVQQLQNRDVSQRKGLVALAKRHGFFASVGIGLRCGALLPRSGNRGGRLVGREGGDVLTIIGSADIRGHREREAGLRAVLARFYPQTTVGAVLASGEDPDRAGLLVTRALASDPLVRGIYLGTTGAREIAAAVVRAGVRERVAIVVHELTESRRTLLRRRMIDAVIDQNPALEARVAIETIARLLGRMEGEPASTRTEIRIYTPENA